MRTLKRATLYLFISSRIHACLCFFPSLARFPSLSLSNPGVVRARVTSREILERCVWCVIGKRLVGERCALIMTVESARVEARQSSVATSDSPVVCHCARLLRFSFEQILDGNATTRSGPYSFRFRLMRAHTCYCRAC